MMAPDAMPTATDIPWTSDPLPRPELLPAAALLALDAGDLLEYAFDLQRDCESVRSLLHETLAALARATVQGDRYQARIRDLMAALQKVRQQLVAVSAQLRALEDQAH